MLIKGGYNILCEMPILLSCSTAEIKNTAGYSFNNRVDVVSPDLGLLFELYEQIRLNLEKSGYMVHGVIVPTTEIRVSMKSQPLKTIPVINLGITRLYIKKYRNSAEKERIRNLHKVIFDSPHHECYKSVFRLKIYVGLITADKSDLEAKAMVVIYKWMIDNNIVLIEYPSRRVTQLRGYLISAIKNNYWVWEQCPVTIK